MNVSKHLGYYILFAVVAVKDGRSVLCVCVCVCVCLIKVIICLPQPYIRHAVGLIINKSCFKKKQNPKPFTFIYNSEQLLDLNLSLFVQVLTVR